MIFFCLFDLLLHAWDYFFTPWHAEVSVLGVDHTLGR